MLNQQPQILAPPPQASTAELGPSLWAGQLADKTGSLSEVSLAGS